MKAVNYQGAFKVKVEDVPKPKLEHPDDIIVKVTTAGRCPMVERGHPSADSVEPGRKGFWLQVLFDSAWI